MSSGGIPRVKNAGNCNKRVKTETKIPPECLADPNLKLIQAAIERIQKDDDNLKTVRAVSTIPIDYDTIIPVILFHAFGFKRKVVCIYVISTG